MPGITPLTYQILLALADGDGHGYGIIKEIEQRFDQPSGHEAPPTMSFLSRAAATSTAKCIDSCSARRRPLALSR